MALAELGVRETTLDGGSGLVTVDLFALEGEKVMITKWQSFTNQ